MGFSLDRIVPWGRSFEEYRQMFGLSQADLEKRILGCGDGPAAFNAESTKRGGRVVSVDPLYAFESVQIRQRIAQTRDAVMAQMRDNQADYVWKSIASPDELERIRLKAMDDFLLDFEAGKEQGRYLSGELPVLPFGEGRFDLALSSHFLFLYSDQLSAEFHLEAIREMLRVAHEVRIFPLLTLDGKRSPHLDRVSTLLTAEGHPVRIESVAYEFQRGGNQTLIVTQS